MESSQHVDAVKPVEKSDLAAITQHTSYFFVV